MMDGGPPSLRHPRHIKFHGRKVLETWWLEGIIACRRGTQDPPNIQTENGLILDFSPFSANAMPIQ